MTVLQLTLLAAGAFTAVSVWSPVDAELVHICNQSFDLVQQASSPPQSVLRAF